MYVVFCIFKVKTNNGPKQSLVEKFTAGRGIKLIVSNVGKGIKIMTMLFDYLAKT